MRTEDTLLHAGLLGGGLETGRPAFERVDISHCPVPPLLFETFCVPKQKQQVLVSIGSPVFSSQVLDMTIKEKI